MAIGRISGAMLKANLERLGTDLAFETDLLYIDVANDRIGINTTTPSQSLQVDNVTINNSQIRSTSGKLDLGPVGDITISGGGASQVLTTDGSGNLSFTSISGGGLVTGRDVTLSYPDDSSLYPTGAINDWTFSTNVSTAIDDLNELAQNVINNTAVINVDFTADTTSGAQGTTVTLTITAQGNPNRYTINWGDGTTDTAVTDSTPSHTYNDNTGSPFSVTVTAFNNSGVGRGSSISKTRTDYISIFGPTPVVSFAAYANSAGGSPITSWDDGATIYFENTTTNTSGATVQYTWAWGDGSSDDVLSSDSVNGGVGGGRLAHTFTTSTEQEQSRTVSLTLDAHNQALPSDIPTSANATYKIYDTHTPEVSLNDNSGINELGTSGHPVTFTNNTEATIGNFSTYGIQYRYNFGDGNTQTVNVGTGAAGDTGTSSLSHTYTLSSSDQNNGTPADYTGNLEVISSHTGSPFASANFTVHVEPDMRANYTASAVTTSDRSGDNQYDLYDFTDLNGNNRALVTLTNSTLPSVTGANYTIDWGDSSTDDTPTEDGSTPGTIGNAITHNYAGTGTGSKNVSLTVSATPDLTAQTDTDNDLTFTVNATPAAPAGVSSKTLSMSTASTGTSPLLAANATDNTGGQIPANGSSVTRYTGSGTVQTNVINDAYNSFTGQTATAKVNGSDSGSKTFTASDNETGTFTSLVVTAEGDAHDQISSSTYPSHFYKVFTARVDHSLGSLSNGYNDFQISHNSTGDTNRVGFVLDDLTTTPVVDLSSATLTQNNAGSFRYISGIPYYNTGSPTLTLAGAELYQWIGQTYRNTSSPFEIASGTNDESTSSSVISTQTKTYANLDGTSTYLSSGIPIANTGKTIGTKYAIGDQSIAITSSSVAAVETIKFRASNVNGTGSYAELTGTKIQVHTASPSGVVEDSIAVPSSLGNGVFTDNGKRIQGISTASDTPAYNGSTDFYTSNAWSGAVTVAGTQEAITRFGTIKHFTTDLSSGYLPAGPDLNTGRSGSQYYTFAFRRQVVANIDIKITAPSGIEGCWIALPGTAIDSSSGINGWLECTTQYNGVGLPGSDTGNGGNGSNGCAYTGGDVIPINTAISNGAYQMTLGTENMSNATGNVMLVRVKLGSGDTITSLSIGVA